MSAMGISTPFLIIPLSANIHYAIYFTGSKNIYLRSRQIMHDLKLPAITNL